MNYSKHKLLISLLALPVLVLALFLAGVDIPGLTSEKWAARVNEKEITKEDVDVSIAIAASEMNSEFNRMFYRNPGTETKKLVAEQLVDKEVVSFEAEKMGLSVTESEIDWELGKYKAIEGPEWFNKFLSDNNMNIDQFRERVRKRLAYEKVYWAVTENAIVSSNSYMTSEQEDKKKISDKKFADWLENVKGNYTIIYSEKYQPR